ncbi:MAG: molybdate ABC transporter substrate-binding protein [Hyphomicrobium sp.]
MPRALSTKLKQAIICLLALLHMSVIPPASAENRDSAAITIFAAASLKTSLDAVAAEFSKATGKKTVISYAASSALAKQIEHAAPADIFISADLAWMDYLAEKALIDTATRSNVLFNRLVLIAPEVSKLALKIVPGFDLASALGDGKLAIGDVQAVPAGKYGKAALEKLGAWSAVEPKVAGAENVRAALALVARGEAVMGIVYHTDAVAEQKVKVVDTFPDNTHPKIVYPAAVTRASLQPETAAAFLAYLKSPPAQAIFAKDGFVIPD